MSKLAEVVAGVREVFMTGRTKPIEWRRQQLNALLKFLEEQRTSLVKVLYEDLKKPESEAMSFELNFTQNDLVDIMNHLSDWMKPEKVKKPFALMLDDAYIIREPYGVALIIGTWNYPLQLTLSPMAGALAAGNCVILKPSEVAPKTAQFLEETLPKYLDKDCVKVINGGVPETTELLKERFDYIFYTGSSGVAKVIYEAAAKNLTPVTLELGGKSPVFVDNTCDLTVVANRLVWGKFSNAGQTCIAPDYVLCTPDVKDALLEVCGKTIQKFYGDDPINSDSYGRIINRRHFDRLKALMSSGQVKFGGKMDEATNYIEPTIVVDVNPTDKIMQEEIFGPILPVITVKDVDEAISFINGKEKPLSMYVFSKNKKVVDKILSSTSSGGVTVNDTLMHITVSSLPFGGVGYSGIGSYHGKFSFDTFSHSRGCLFRSLAGEKLNELRYPPFTEKKLNLMTWLMKTSLKSSRFFFATLPLIIIGILLGYLAKVFNIGAFSPSSTTDF